MISHSEHLRPRAAPLGIVLLCAAYRALLEWNYVTFVAPSYAYMGFESFRPALVLLAVSWSATMLPTLWLPTKISRPSDFVAVFLYLATVVPATFVPFRAEAVDPTTYVLFVLALLVGHGMICVLPRRVRLASRTQLGFRLSPSFLAIFAATAALPAIVVFGLPSGLPSLADVYAVRDNYAAGLQGPVGRVAAYTTIWLGNVLVPLSIAVGLSRRRLSLVVVAFALQLLVFSITGFKSVLFGLPLAVGGWIVMSRESWRRSGVLLGVACALVALSSAFDAVLERPLVSGIGIRRMIHMPGLLSGFYVDFYSKNDPAMLEHSIAKRVQEQRYDATPPFLIGETYFGSPDISANAHVWADAYANFRLSGMLAATALLVAVLLVLDAVYSRYDASVFVPALGAIAFSLSNSALLSVLMTHGLLAMIVVVSAVSLGYDQPRRERKAQA